MRLTFTWADVSWRGGTHSAWVCCAGTALHTMHLGPDHPWTEGCPRTAARPGPRHRSQGTCGTWWLCFPSLRARKRPPKTKLWPMPHYSSLPPPPLSPPPPYSTGHDLEQHGSAFPSLQRRERWELVREKMKLERRNKSRWKKGKQSIESIHWLAVC